MAKKYVWKYVCIFLWKDASVLPDIVVTLQLPMHSLYLWLGKQAANVHYALYVLPFFNQPVKYSLKYFYFIYSIFTEIYCIIVLIVIFPGYYLTLYPGLRNLSELYTLPKRWFGNDL